MALRDEVASAIGFVLRLRVRKRLRRTLKVREETHARILAQQIVAHLERCRFRFVQEPPAACHHTPRSDDGNRRPER